MKKIFFVLIAVLLCASSYACGISDMNEGNFMNVENQDIRFNQAIPSSDSELSKVKIDSQDEQ